MFLLPMPFPPGGPGGPPREVVKHKVRLPDGKVIVITKVDWVPGHVAGFPPRCVPDFPSFPPPPTHLPFPV
jgi:hypothetical protein